ncbi:MAG: VWA domain-containing protein [Phycisphaerales bacterium]|nr:VWA domain-containing protein [Phycisphaerales bacterium]
MPGVAQIVFNRPQWLLLLIPVTIILVWIGRKSLSGMGTKLRRVALACRVLVAALLLAAVAEPQWTKESDSVAVTAVVDVSRSQPVDTITRTREFLAKASGEARSIDLVGMVTAGREAYVQQLPRSVRSSESLEATDIGATDGTNLEAAVRIALASMPPNAANRLLLVSDGNENVGSVMQAAKAAKAAGVPIDVLPIRYTNNAEVLVERLIAPSVSRQGENARLRAVLTATRAARGFLTILMNGEAIDLNGDGQGVAKAVELEAGVNVQEALVRLPRATGPVRFEAVFEASPSADGKAGDTLTENNRAISVTFVSGAGRVLVLTNKPDEASQLVNALRESKIETEMRSTTEGPPSLAELGSYECVVLVNTERFDFSERQQEELKSYINDLGGGLIMVGGDQSFGAGGWIGSSLAEALPIKLDPPQKREMPRGALVLVMHSCEMPNGNFWGRRTGEAAINSLSSKDMIGIIEYNWQGGDNWVHPLAVLGDKAAALRSINSLTYGDAPSFDTMLTDAYNGLKTASAGQKHIIIISDGDPQQNDQQLISNIIAAKISISTVAVFPHTYGNASADLNRMRKIATQTGGRYYRSPTPRAG